MTTTHTGCGYSCNAGKSRDNKKKLRCRYFSRVLAAEGSGGRGADDMTGIQKSEKPLVDEVSFIFNISVLIYIKGVSKANNWSFSTLSNISC